MSSTKRHREGFYLGDDDDRPILPLSNPQRRNTRLLHSQTTDQHRDKDIPFQSFAECFSNAVPTILVPHDIAAYLKRESNSRLDLAELQGVELDEIYIGDDCLPTWLGMYWDQEAESVHSVLQSRLMHHQISQELGDMVRREIIGKGNRKLNDAMGQDISLRYVSFDDSLLPTWAATDDSDHQRSTMDDACKGSGALLYDCVPEVEERDEDLPSGIEMASPEELYGLSDTDSFTTVSDSAMESPQSESANKDSIVFDDVIMLNNYVSDQPTYSEPSANIFHDADLVGESHAYHGADLEIYVVEDDEEAMELPEVELAIDGDAYEYHFGDEGVVDIEMPGVKFCIQELAEMEEAEIEEVLPVKGVQKVDVIVEPAKNDGQVVEKAVVVDGVLSEEDEPTEIFEKTEYGYRW